MRRNTGAAMLLLLLSVGHVQADGSCEAENLELELASVTIDGAESSHTDLGWPTAATLDVHNYGDNDVELGEHFITFGSAVQFEEPVPGCGADTPCRTSLMEGSFSIGIYTKADGTSSGTMVIDEETVSLQFTDSRGEVEAVFDIVDVVIEW